MRNKGGLLAVPLTCETRARVPFYTRSPPPSGELGKCVRAAKGLSWVVKGRYPLY